MDQTAPEAVKPMRILIMAAEMAPLAKTGQVAEVVGGLARALAELGHDVRVAMPRYGHLDTLRFSLEPTAASLAVPLDDHQEQVAIHRASMEPGVPVYLVESRKYFGQHVTSMYTDDADPFVLYCRASLEMLKHPTVNWRPEVIHCHDWQTAIVPNWMATLYRDDPFFADTGTVLTIHRLSNQGIFGYRVLEAAGLTQYGFMYHAALADLSEVVALLGHGLYYADAITTVSERYARDIQTPEYGECLDPLLRERSESLYGIRHGIDTASYDPSCDPYLASAYSAQTLDRRADNKAALQQLFALEQDPHAPLIGMVSRLNDSKGLDLLAQVFESLLVHLRVQFAILGVGDTRYHDLLTSYAVKFPGRVGVRLTFDEATERRIYGGSDLFLMPSRVEPCGLGHMLAMRYGSVPVVRATGGLADVVQNYAPRPGTGNGFSFGPYDAMALYATLVRAIEVYGHGDLWRLLQERCMATDFSWRAPAAKYVEVYRRAQESHRLTPRLANGWVPEDCSGIVS